MVDTAISEWSRVITNFNAEAEGLKADDIVAHETTHALLDGLHGRFIEPSNPDALAFHEAFADLVALFQHFTFPDVLRHQIARTRGEWAAGAAVEFYIHGLDVGQEWAPYAGWAKVSDGKVSDDGTEVVTADGQGIPVLSTFGVRLAQ